MGLPPKILKQGVTDMVRISDARMSGTAYGTAVLHVSPEAAVGGPLALVQDGDMIELDVEGRTLQSRGQRRRTGAPPRRLDAGARRIRRAATSISTRSTVQQAHLGADLDFLRGRRGDVVTRESH